VDNEEEEDAIKWVNAGPTGRKAWERRGNSSTNTTGRSSTTMEDGGGWGERRYLYVQPPPPPPGLGHEGIQEGRLPCNRKP